MLPGRYLERAIDIKTTTNICSATATTNGTIFSTQNKYRNFIRLGCTRIWTQQLKTGIAKLGKLAEEMICIHP